MVAAAHDEIEFLPADLVEDISANLPFLRQSNPVGNDQQVDDCALCQIIGTGTKQNDPSFRILPANSSHDGGFFGGEPVS